MKQSLYTAALLIAMHIAHGTVSAQINSVRPNTEPAPIKTAATVAIKPSAIKQANNDKPNTTEAKPLMPLIVPVTTLAPVKNVTLQIKAATSSALKIQEVNVPQVLPVTALKSTVPKASD